MDRSARSTARPAMLALLVVGVLSTVDVAAGSADWVDAVRQCWNDNARNTSIGCLFTDGQWRGTRSGRECLMEAVRTARQNDRENAVRWILACRCGDSEQTNRKAIREREDDAVRFVVDSYGAFVR